MFEIGLVRLIGVHDLDGDRFCYKPKGHLVVSPGPLLGFDLLVTDAKRPKLGAVRQPDRQKLLASVDNIEFGFGSLAALNIEIGR